MDMQDIVLTTIIAILIQFVFGIKSGNLLVSIFTGFNTSIYSQILALSCALYTENIAKMWIEEIRENNLWTSLFFKIIVSNLVFLTEIRVYKLYLIETLILDVIFMILAVIIGQIIERTIQNRISISSKIEDIFKYLNIVIFLVIIFNVILGGM